MVGFHPSQGGISMVAKAVRDLVRRLTEQRATQEMSAAEAEMMEHVAERQALRQQMQEDAAADMQARNEHEQARQALQEFGERYSYQERNSNREIVQRQMRLSATMNKPLVLARYSPGCSPRDLLIRGCKDLHLQQQWATASEAFERASEAVRVAELQMQTAMSRAADARRDRVEILGSIRRQYGSEGTKWRRVDQDDQVSIVAVVSADGNPLMHEQNVEFLNCQLARPNREIRQSASAVAAATTGSLTQTLQAAREALTGIENLMVQSEM